MSKWAEVEAANNRLGQGIVELRGLMTAIKVTQELSRIEQHLKEIASVAARARRDAKKVQTLVGQLLSTPVEPDVPKGKEVSDG